ncbi:MAG: DUF389 domain-containing protein [Prolixibacteraceae bacterium]
MRQLTVKIAKEKKENMGQILTSLDAKNVVNFDIDDHTFYEFYLDNKKVQSFFATGEADDAEIALNPHGLIPLHPPAGDAPDQVADVSIRSPVEIFLSSLQSIGSVGGLIGYSIASGIVAFIGIYTDVIYLLTASMLIAPFAGPVMNAALAGAAGEPRLLWKSLIRYFLAIGISIVVSFLLSFAFAVDVLPPLADSLSRLSLVNLLLPLAAGFAGAISIISSERDNLVSGAGVGILVAASLAPPAAIVGITLYMGNGPVLIVNLVKLALQLAGIQLAASLVFRYWGKIKTEGVRFHKGKQPVFWLSLAISIAAIAVLAAFQKDDVPLLQRQSLVYDIRKSSSAFIKNESEINLLDLNIKITNQKKLGKNMTWCNMTVFAGDSSESKQKQLQEDYRRMLDEKFPKLFFITEIKFLSEEKQIN